ncbi:hypothetical protein Tco_0981624, partial [Tanacetum coccineum]
KPLVQQRDSLKQVIVEKTNKLDKCLIELQEKSTALEAADSLKEALLQRDVNYLAEDRLELDKCSNKIENLSEEHILKDQNGSLQVDLQRYEDKAALLREKLFMVVKKDNGLYFTGRVIEATDEIAIPIDVTDPVEKAKWCATYLNECQLEIVKVERVGDLKDKAGKLASQLQQRMIVATDEVVIPANVTEPLEKVMWCATYIHECQVAKAKKNYEKKWEEVSTHAINLNEARKSIKSLEDATSQLQTHVSQLSNSEVRSLYHKIKGIAIPFPNIGEGETEAHNSQPSQNVFYIVENAFEIERLKDEFEEANNEPEYKHKRNGSSPMD